MSESLSLDERGSDVKVQSSHLGPWAGWELRVGLRHRHYLCLRSRPHHCHHSRRHLCHFIVIITKSYTSH